MLALPADEHARRHADGASDVGPDEAASATDRQQGETASAEAGIARACGLLGGSPAHTGAGKLPDTLACSENAVEPLPVTLD